MVKISNIEKIGQPEKLQNYRKLFEKLKLVYEITSDGETPQDEIINKMKELLGLSRQLVDEIETFLEFFGKQADSPEMDFSLAELISDRENTSVISIQPLHNPDINKNRKERLLLAKIDRREKHIISAQSTMTSIPRIKDKNRRVK